MKTTKNPTIYDVAELAEVSEATVSYILRGRRGGKSRISEATRQKVLTATNTLGYAPNSAAINLSTRRTDRISLVLSQIGAPYHHAIARDVLQIAIEHNYTLSISISETPQQQDLIIEQLHQRDCPQLHRDSSYISLSLWLYRMGKAQSAHSRLLFE